MPLDRLLRHLISWQHADGGPVPLREMTVEQARERYRANNIRPTASAEFAGTIVEQIIGTEDGSALRLRVYTPESDRGRVVTYLRGGGWVLGDIDTHDSVCRVLATSLGAVVVSADYRRPPEFPYPAPLLDAITAARWTDRSFPCREHVIAGDSAGASLSLGVSLDARDSGDLRFAAQLLVCPTVDPSLHIAAASEYAEGYLLGVEDMAWYYDLYLPDHRLRGEPAVDLLNADLRGVAPTVVATAEFDPLHDEGMKLVGKLRATGTLVRHVPGSGLVHGYFLMHDIVPAAATCVREVLQQLDAVLIDRSASATRGS